MIYNNIMFVNCNVEWQKINLSLFSIMCITIDVLYTTTVKTLLMDTSQ